jgi:Zn-dependent peptidase ImmA (M78 family)/DNA-binding XRE family transcriptional regulator
MANFGIRLKSARRMRGLSMQALADIMNPKVSKQAIHKYESGKMNPDSRVLIALSAALNVRQEYLLREEACVIDQISFRKLKRLPKREQVRIIEISKDFLERYVELEKLLGIENQVKELKKKYVVSASDQIEKYAMAIREHWNLGNDPIYNVIELLEDMGVKIVEIEADSGFSGMSTWVSDSIPLIVLNTSNVPHDRLRFTALHELGHLVLDLSNYNEKQKEAHCNLFAGAMLMPEAKFKAEIGENRHNILPLEMMYIKRQYGISMAAQLFRARDLGLISEAYFQASWRFYSKKGWKTKEPEDYNGEEKSNRFDQLLLRAYAEELITSSKAASLKNLKLAEFREYVSAIA